MSQPNYQLGHAAFVPTAPTLANGGLAPTKDNMRLRISQLERENAALREENAKLRKRVEESDAYFNNPMNFNP